MIKRLWPFLLVLATGDLAAAQELPCPAVQVNTYTTDGQAFPAIAADPAGNFVVVWHSYGQDGSYGGVFGQRFDAAGARRGPEFQVNTYTTSDQIAADVASDASGNFVVTWLGQDGHYGGVFARRFDPSGTPQGPEFQVNTLTTNNQVFPAVASAANGNFIVVWTETIVDASESDVFARLYSASGVPQGPEFRVNTYTSGLQGLGRDVAADASGNFVVIWDSYGQDGSGWGVFAQRFDAAGVRQGPEFPINAHTTGFQVLPRMFADPSGNFVVVWEDDDQGGGTSEVVGRRFDAAGVPQGPDFQINTYTAYSQGAPRGSFLANGDFVVVWESLGQDGSDRGVFGRRFSTSGVPRGPEFQVNTQTSDAQYAPGVAGGANGGFIVTWSGAPDGEVFASLDCAHFYTLPPCRLLDTREFGNPPLDANTTRTFPVAGACGIPLDARAVALNATAFAATDRGHLSFFPAGAEVPMTSTLNFTPERPRSNNAVVQLGTNGQISVRCEMPPGSMGRTHLLLDAYGFFKR